MKNLKSIEQVLRNGLKNAKNLDKQKKNMFFLIIGVFIVFVVYGIFSPSKSKTKKTDETKKFSVTKEAVKAEDKWLIDASKKLDSLSDEIAKSQEEKTELLQRLEDMQNSIVAMNEMLSMQQQIIENQSKQGINPSSSESQNHFEYQDSEAFTNRTISTYTLNLTAKKDNSHFYKNTKNYIAQGSYASGVLISAVDAAVGVSSRVDPRPVLIRLNGDAVSASINGRKEKTDLRGCVITGGAEGDLSSERIYIKLSRMTCSKKQGEVFEVPVKGYVSGIGKVGIRGVVVSRDWDKLSKAFAAGLISGFGASYSQSLRPPAALTTNGVVMTQQQSLGNAMKSGTGEGIKKSGDMLTDYYIKRAEQYQPVISIPAGIDIEVVFVEGFSLEPSSQKDKKIN